MIDVQLWVLPKSHSSFQQENAVYFLVQVRKYNIFIWVLLQTEFTISDFRFIMYSWYVCLWCPCVTSVSLMFVSIVSLRCLLATCRVGWVASAMVLLVRYSTDTLNVSHLREKSDTSQNLSFPISPVLCTTERQTFYTEKCHKRIWKILDLR